MAVFFESMVSNVLAGIVALFAVIFVFFCWDLNYWSKRGVPHTFPIPIVGNFLGVLLGTETFTTILRPIYKRFRKHGYCGIFQWKRPVLVVFEPELVKQILTKDFSNFHDRGQPYDPEGDPLTAHLFNLEGTKWRNLRNKLSPTFTSGKLKLMFPLMVDIGNELNNVIRNKLKKEKHLELKDYMTRYATDLIGSCAFGIQCNSLSGEVSEFVRMSRDVFRPNIFILARFFLQNIHPDLARLIPFKWCFSKTSQFFINLMKDTIEYREQNKIVRNDFVHLLMQVREADKLETDRENNIEFTPGVMAAQGFIFFLAGLENIANTVCWAIHELTINPSLQEQAVSEIRSIMQTTEDKITYEGLKKMVLMERILRETLRKYIPIGFLFRVASGNVELGDTGLVVEKGTLIMIPSDSMQLDPEFYPDPERFDPDRFTEEEKEKRHPYTYLPFGDGPRLCIAERFAMLEMKLALVSLLAHYKFSIGPKTETKPKLDVKAFVPSPLNGFWFDVEARSST